MYRIDTEKLANFKEATIGLREGLEEARDNHVLQMGALEENWAGEGADSALTVGQDLIVQMEDEIASLKGLEAVLGNALENARRLRVQSKRFVEMLKDDESSLHYTGHGYRIGAPIEDGIISLDESTVTQLVESCNHAAETAREIEDITYEIDELLGSMEYVHIDISDQTAKIRKDCTKVERLEEYGRSYKRYAEEFIELDRYLCKALEPYQSDENKGLTEMDLRRYNYYVNSPGKREKPVEGEALPVIAGGVNVALLGVEPFVSGEEYTQNEETHENMEGVPESILITTPSDEIVEFIKRKEDFVPYVYDANRVETDPLYRYNHEFANYTGEEDWTIGYGHKLQESELETYGTREIKEEEALELFRLDMENTLNASFVPMLEKYKIHLTQGQFDAMVSFTFRYGEYIWLDEYEGDGDGMREFIKTGNYDQNSLEIIYALYRGLGNKAGNRKRSVDEMKIFMGDESAYYIDSEDDSIPFELIYEYYPQYWNAEYERAYEEYLQEVDEE